MRLAALLIALAGLVAYANSLHGAFVFDDQRTVLENRSIESLWPPWRPLRPPSHQAASGRPIFNASLALDHAIGGREPVVYHATSVAIHLLAGVTLFGVARRGLRGPRVRARTAAAATGLAAAGALLWTVHPLNSQAVSYVTQRCEALMGLFVLLAVYAALRSWATPGGSRRWQAVAVACALLGVGTKETAGVTPLLVLACDVLLFRGGVRAALRSSPGLYLGLAAVPVALGALLAWGGQPGQAVETEAYGSLGYARTQSLVILHYLRLAFWPVPLAFDHAWPIAGWREALPGIAVLSAALAAVGMATWRRRPAALPGVWLFVTLAPTSSLVPLRFVALEYRMYLPLAAVAMGTVLAVWWLGVALGRRRRWRLDGPQARLAAAALLVVAVTSLAATTRERNRDYESPLALWQATASVRPGSALAQLGLGHAWIRQGEHQRALRHFARAVELAPDDARAHSNLGGANELLGRPAEARRSYQEALRLDPGLAHAHNNLGNLLVTEGRLGEAAWHYREAIRLRPGLPDAHYNLARLLRARGRTAEARRRLEDALRADPDFEPARRALEER